MRFRLQAEQLTRLVHEFYTVSAAGSELRWTSRCTFVNQTSLPRCAPHTYNPLPPINCALPQDEQKHAFVHAFNHRQADFDFKRMLDSLGHDTSQLPRD